MKVNWRDVEAARARVATRCTHAVPREKLTDTPRGPCGGKMQRRARRDGVVVWTCRTCGRQSVEVRLDEVVAPPSLGNEQEPPSAASAEPPTPDEAEP